MRLQYSPGPRLFFLPFVFLCGLPLSSTEQVADQSAARTAGMIERLSKTPEARERTLTAEYFANERLSVWQKRLNLEDWNISIAVARSTDLKPRTLGNIHWDANKKKAVIRILDPADYNMTFQDMLADMEFTVVHELI